MAIFGRRLEMFQAAGFPLGGEPVVALDLVNTSLASEVAGAALPPDRLEDPEAARRWWQLEAERLPEGPVPALSTTRRLRGALRAMFEARIDGTPIPETALDDVNGFASAAPMSRRLNRDGHLVTRWHLEHGGSAVLAQIATEAIELIADEHRVRMLRRCRNDDCSILFLADNPRRVWCASNVCGNRARVARHYQRSKAAGRSAL
jgi:predicted RNA-binding Zn ribbon-like protein